MVSFSVVIEVTHQCLGYTEVCHLSEIYVVDCCKDANHITVARKNLLRILSSDLKETCCKCLRILLQWRSRVAEKSLKTLQIILKRFRWLDLQDVSYVGSNSQYDLVCSFSFIRLCSEKKNWDFLYDSSGTMVERMLASHPRIEQVNYVGLHSRVENDGDQLRLKYMMNTNESILDVWAMLIS